jgi:DNA-binding MarR family transcriptional regulator
VGRKLGSELDQDIAEFWKLLFTIVIDGEKRFTAHMAAHDLTPPQFYVLKTLVENGGRCPIGQIARQHHLTNATMTGLVQRLEAMTPPLVMRERNASDLRSVYVVLTPAGQERFNAVQIDLLQQLQAVLGLISQEERQHLMHFLSRYVEIVTQLFPVDNIQADK